MQSVCILGDFFSLMIDNDNSFLHMTQQRIVLIPWIHQWVEPKMSTDTELRLTYSGDTGWNLEFVMGSAKNALVNLKIPPNEVHSDLHQDETGVSETREKQDTSDLNLHTGSCAAETSVYIIDAKRE